jgi:hypothetical protein
MEQLKLKTIGKQYQVDFQQEKEYLILYCKILQNDKNEIYLELKIPESLFLQNWRNDLMDTAKFNYKDDLANCDEGYLTIRDITEELNGMVGWSVIEGSLLFEVETEKNLALVSFEIRKRKDRKRLYYNCNLVSFIENACRIDDLEIYDGKSVSIKSPHAISELFRGLVIEDIA